MREVVEVLVQALVDRPEESVVSENERGNTLFLNVKVGHGDMGKVIGRQGRIINAIRAVAATAAARQNMRCVVNVDGA
jgi:predicted RNA-binding protein YlqC (UPF0109 family)